MLGMQGDADIYPQGGHAQPIRKEDKQLAGLCWQLLQPETVARLLQHNLGGAGRCQERPPLLQDPAEAVRSLVQPERVWPWRQDPEGPSQVHLVSNG